jgi:outer membrane protein insertion porin family
MVFAQDLAGLGGDVKYLRTRGEGTKYWSVLGDWVFSAHAEGGYIHPLTDGPGPNRDPIRITDRFFGTQLRGFDIRGIGPRIRRTPYNAEGVLEPEGSRITDALGGRAYYMGRLELEFPTTSGLRSMGIRPSAYVDIGSVFRLTPPELTDIVGVCLPTSLNPGAPRIDLGAGENCPATGYVRTPGYREEFLGGSATPRLSVGIGVNWVSPFGPFRIDVAKALLEQEGDDTKLFSFTVGTQF